jgi:hypothetical protein
MSVARSFPLSVADVVSFVVESVDDDGGVVVLGDGLGVVVLWAYAAVASIAPATLMANTVVRVFMRILLRSRETFG